MRVPLRSTRGYTPTPRWGKSNRVVSRTCGRSGSFGYTRHIKRNERLIDRPSDRAIHPLAIGNTLSPNQVTFGRYALCLGGPNGAADCSHGWSAAKPVY